MRVLSLATYPVEAAATRYRLYQFVEPLAAHGIDMTVRPFLDSRVFASLYKRDEWPRTALGLLRSSLRRLGDLREAQAADVLLVQREAMFFGPPVVEWLAAKWKNRPLVLDLDDATYIRYESPTNGRLASALKWFGKTDDLIDWAKVVTCGNRSIAEYVAARGTRAVIIPTVVDTELFRPSPDSARSHGMPPVLGWIGTHSTYPFLESLFPVLQRLARTHEFRLKVVGAGREVSVPGVTVENLAWRLEREVADFQSFDIGLYPLIADEWSAGKSGFKAIQYMAVGLPYVATPVGASAEIGEAGVTHLLAASDDEWYEALSRLLADAPLRARLGEAGRAHALRHYNVPAQAAKLERVLRDAAEV